MVTEELQIFFVNYAGIRRVLSQTTWVSAFRRFGVQCHTV